MMREAKTGGFRWLPSYYNAARNLPDADRLALYDAILDHGFGNDVGDLPPLVKCMLELIMPTIDKSVAFEEKQRKNGLKGGRPKAQTDEHQKPKRNPKPKVAKTQTKPNCESGENLDVAIDVAIDSDIDIESAIEGEYEGKPHKCGTALAVFDEFAESDADLRSALRGFHEMRVKIKKPLTARAAQMIVNELTRLSTDPGEQAAILDNSTVHGWQGVFPLDKPKAQKPGNGPIMETNRQEPDGNKYTNWIDDIDPETGLPWVRDG